MASRRYIFGLFLDPLHPPIFWYRQAIFFDLKVPNLMVWNMYYSGFKLSEEFCEVATY